MAEKGRIPPPQFTPPSPAKEAAPRAEEMEKQVEEAEQLEGWGSHCHHHPPYSWSR